MLVNFIHVPKNGGISIKEICRKTNNNPLKYNPHYADIYDPRVSNQLIVLRDPVDRLISAIRYTIKSFYLMCEGEEHNHRLDYDQRKHLKTHRVPTFVGKNKARLFRAVFNRGTQTPNDWITALKETTHDCHEPLHHIISNNEIPPCKIGPQQCEHIYPFEPQSSWHHEPRFVILMNNFQEEIRVLLKSLGVDVDIPHINDTSAPDSNKISDKNIDWVKEKYAKDFELYDNYNEMPYKERIVSKL